MKRGHPDPRGGFFWFCAVAAVASAVLAVVFATLGNWDRVLTQSGFALVATLLALQDDAIRFERWRADVWRDRWVNGGES